MSKKTGRLATDLCAHISRSLLTVSPLQIAIVVPTTVLFEHTCAGLGNYILLVSGKMIDLNISASPRINMMHGYHLLHLVDIQSGVLTSIPPRVTTTFSHSPNSGSCLPACLTINYIRSFCSLVASDCYSWKMQSL